MADGVGAAVVPRLAMQPGAYPDIRTIPLVDPSFTPDGAASVLTDGTSNTNSAYLKHFPYLGTPAGGYQSTPGTPAA